MLNKFYKHVRIVYQDGQECEGSERQIQSAKFPFYHSTDYVLLLVKLLAWFK